MYPDTHCDVICSGDNVIVGLGDSFTQGCGALSLETWASMPGNPATYNISGQYYIDEMGKNNWVRQLVNNHLPNYKTYNLGQNGGGNRGTIKELFLYPLPNNVGNVIVILMATSLERLNLLKKDTDSSANTNWHAKWQTILPVREFDGLAGVLNKAYYDLLWCRRNDALEFLFNVAALQYLCKANGYSFLFASAFDDRINKEGIIEALGDKAEFHTMIDWSNQITIPGRLSFMDMFNQLEYPRSLTQQLTNSRDGMSQIMERSAKLKMPTKYITPCGHWTIEGQAIVAKYLFEEITKRNLI